MFDCGLDLQRDDLRSKRPRERIEMAALEPGSGQRTVGHRPSIAEIT